MRKLVLAALLVTSISRAADADTFAVRVGKLWDGEKVVSGALVIVEQGRIKSVAAGNPAAPAGMKVVDWSRYYGLPGLIDVHTHMTYFWGREPGTRPQGQTRMPAVTVFLAQDNARKTLETGVTTVRDLGSQEYTDIAMRDLINGGAMTGPRMIVCGYGLNITRGSARAPATPPSPGTADGPDEVMKAVRRQIAAGADVIKMYGSIGGFENVGTQQTFTYEEMKAAVDTTHTLKRKIAIHSYGPEGARDAVRAGTDSLEHAIDIDEATLAAMAKNRIFYVPTIDHNRYYMDSVDDYQFRPGAKGRLGAYLEKNLETARRAQKAGVPFAMGSDAVYTMFGQNTRELAWFVKAGMTPEQALKTATVNAAELLGMQSEIGRIAKGHFADLVAVEGDPLADINVAISKVKSVMKGGVIVVNK